MVIVIFIFFRYPPYKLLDREFREIYKDKKIYRINLNDPELRKIILNIDYGWKNSHRDEESRTLGYYQNISVADYFGEFNSKNKLLFSSLSHISISVKNDIIPSKFITEISIPNSIDDIKKEEENVTESVVPNHVKNKHAFHLSERDLSGTTISPRIPSYLSDPIKVKEHKKLGLYEDASIKRVCVSFSIDNSLKALLPDITEHPERKNEVIGRVFNVHITEKPFILYKHINNRKIVNDKLVFDAKITKENWILEPVKLIKVGKIQVNGIKRTEIKRVNDKLTMRVQEFEWDWIEKERRHDLVKSNIEIENQLIQESALSSEDRNDLIDKSFGLPSLRKYPLNDKEHVLQASPHVQSCRY